MRPSPACFGRQREPSAAAAPSVAGASGASRGRPPRGASEPSACARPTPASPRRLVQSHTAQPARWATASGEAARADRKDAGEDLVRTALTGGLVPPLGDCRLEQLRPQRGCRRRTSGRTARVNERPRALGRQAGGCAGWSRRAALAPDGVLARLEVVDRPRPTARLRASAAALRAARAPLRLPRAARPPRSGAPRARASAAASSSAAGAPRRPGRGAASARCRARCSRSWIRPARAACRSRRLPVSTVAYADAERSGWEKRTRPASIVTTSCSTAGASEAGPSQPVAAATSATVGSARAAAAASTVRVSSGSAAMRACVSSRRLAGSFAGAPSACVPPASPSVRPSSRAKYGLPWAVACTSRRAGRDSAWPSRARSSPCTSSSPSPRARQLDKAGKHAIRRVAVLGHDPRRGGRGGRRRARRRGGVRRRPARARRHCRATARRQPPPAQGAPPQARAQDAKEAERHRPLVDRPRLRRLQQERRSERVRLGRGQLGKGSRATRRGDRRRRRGRASPRPRADEWTG